MKYKKHLTRRHFIQNSGLACLATTLPLGLKAYDTMQDDKNKISRSFEEKVICPRLIVNDDASTFLYQGDNLNSNDLKAYMSRWEGTNVDMVAYCVAFGGYVTYYQSEITEPVGTGFKKSSKVQQNRFFRNRERLVSQVGDYIGFVFSCLLDMGIAPIASFRMNDAHMSSNPLGPVAGNFWKSNPQWRLGEPYGYYGVAMDYAVPEVRDYLRQLVNEVISKFPNIAGIELDGMRSPYFFKYRKGKEQAPIMNEFMRQIRSDLDYASNAGGRPRYILRVNVPRSPELAMECGMDVITWDKENLVDGISPGSYGTDFQIPFERWKSLLSNRIQIHAYMNSSRGSSYHSLEEYRGASSNAYHAGADGIYMFNLPNFDELSGLLLRPAEQAAFPIPHFMKQCWHPDLLRTQKCLNELDHISNFEKKDKKYLFFSEPKSKYRHFVPEYADIQRDNPQPADLSFRCYDDYSAAKEIRLELKTVSVSIFDQFKFKLNDQLIPSSRLKRLHAPGGRDRRIHPTVLEPYSLYVIHLSKPDGLLKKGENHLTVELTKQDPDILGKVELREMELFVNYI